MEINTAAKPKKKRVIPKLQIEESHSRPTEDTEIVEIQSSNGPSSHQPHE